MIFTYFLLDDSLEIHELFGVLISNKIDFLDSFYNLEELGEMIFAGGLGLIIIIFLALTFIKGSRVYKKVSVDLIFLLCILAFFGVFMDIFYIIIEIKPGSLINLLLSIIEDGGEMLTISFTLWYVFNIKIQKGEPSMFLHELLPLPKLITKLITKLID
jgi:glucan phosphoethanolaminetransferase (alkaline phosphatase superfamily)